MQNRDRFIIELYLSGLNGEEIGARLGITRQRAGQIINRLAKAGHVVKRERNPIKAGLGVNEIYCKSCKKIGLKDSKEFYKISRWSFRCRQCNTEMLKKYRQTRSGKEATLKSISTYESRNPNRRLAWDAAAKIPKQPCIICGEMNVHRHHPNPLKKMDVIFLCPLHHKRVHLGLVAI